MSDQLNGVVNGYYVCNTERDVELSNRIAARKYAFASITTTIQYETRIN